MRVQLFQNKTNFEALKYEIKYYVCVLKVTNLKGSNIIIYIEWGVNEFWLQFHALL